MKTKQDIITARENNIEVSILLNNGKTMSIDFRTNCIYRLVPNKGVEQTREFHFDTPKMYKLALTYLNKQTN
tara:strand:+ start:2974 stop:3189 length:216 start_codon:yes stop_codon:yes gene_type:complete